MNISSPVSRQRRVLLAVSSLAAGGAERAITELANGWAVKGWQVALLTLSTPGSDHYSLTPAIERIALDIIWDSPTLWHGVASNIRRSFAIRTAVRRFGPDVVVSFVEQTNIRMLAALVGTGIPVIVSERIDPRQHPVGLAWTAARRLLYPLARRVVVQTEAVAEWARRVVAASRVRVIPNFVREMPEPPEWSVRSSQEILAVGRLDKQKGFDLLLEAFARSGLAARGARLTLLGEGPERSALERQAQALGIAERVTMPGVVRDPETWMARAAVFVLPSRYEGFPNALLEAMAMGCPVIATDCDSGPREIICHGENGWLVPVEDANALSAALRRLFEDEALRCRLGTEAVKVRERYAKAKILSRWETLIEEVLA